MKKYITLAFIAISIWSCQSKKRRPIQGNSAFQVQMNTTFKDASTSPLTKKGLKNFTGLDFYPIDKKYKVTAKLTKTPDAGIFKFPTTTDRVAVYQKYGVVSFTIDGKPLQLDIYKDEEPIDGYENELFLPFFDNTSGTTSYAGGRFIDVLTSDEQPDGTIVIDFNEAYNPYCAYSDRYSCPITPRSNYLDVDIKAGVMAYKK